MTNQNQATLVNTPCPTPSRAIYGFVLYVASYVLYGAYILWAVLPDSWLASVGITYIPARHWVITFPILMYFSIVLLVVVYGMLYLINSSDMVYEEEGDMKNFHTDVVDDLTDLDLPVHETPSQPFLIGKHSLRNRTTITMTVNKQKP